MRLKRAKISRRNGGPGPKQLFQRLFDPPWGASLWPPSLVATFKNIRSGAKVRHRERAAKIEAGFALEAKNKEMKISAIHFIPAPLKRINRAKKMVLG